MDGYLLRIFQTQVATQCYAAVRAAAAAQQVLNTGGLVPDFWCEIQSCLNAVANISKALYASDPAQAASRKILRESLGISEPNVFEVSGRIMRNHFEHFDERLDRWYSTSADKNHADNVIGPPGTISGMADGDMFRVFDTTTGDIVFWGDRYPLVAILREVRSLQQVADREATRLQFGTDADD